jgi:predicted MPP superfamily phosphohydrolase
MQKENVIEIRKLTNKRKPDIVVFSGDLIAKNYNLDSKEQESLIKELKKINSSLGKYAILGDEDNEKISTIFNQSDFTILRNDYDLIYKDNSTPILLIGLSSEKKGQDIEKAYSYFQQETHNSNIYTIALLHEPDKVDDILSTKQTDLFLAGHSHNGDIRLPFTHTALKKKEGAKKYDQDRYTINQSELFVSSGLGTESGIRLFCRPSINFFRISNK